MPTSAQARLAFAQVSRSALWTASALWVPHPASRAAKEEIKIKRDIAISNLRGVSGFLLLVLRSLHRDACPITAGIHWDWSACTTQTAKAGVPGWSPFRAHAFRSLLTSRA